MVAVDGLVTAAAGDAEKYHNAKVIDCGTSAIADVLLKAAESQPDGTLTDETWQSQQDVEMHEMVGVDSNDAKDYTVEIVHEIWAQSILMYKFCRDSFLFTKFISRIEQMTEVLNHLRSLILDQKDLIDYEGNSRACLWFWSSFSDKYCYIWKPRTCQFWIAVRGTVT